MHDVQKVATKRKGKLLFTQQTTKRKTDITEFFKNFVKLISKILLNFVNFRKLKKNSIRGLKT